MQARVKLALVLSSLLLAACSSSSNSPRAVPAPPATNDDGSLITGVITARFDPATSTIPTPNNLLFSGTTDLTLNIPVANPANFGDPQVAQRHVVVLRRVEHLDLSGAAARGRRGPRAAGSAAGQGAAPPPVLRAEGLAHAGHLCARAAARGRGAGRRSQRGTACRRRSRRGTASGRGAPRALAQGYADRSHRADAARCGGGVPGPRARTGRPRSGRACGVGP